MSTLYLITGSCPISEAEVRLEMAEYEEAAGNHEAAEGWRQIVDRMREDWSDRSDAGNTRRALQRIVGPDPEALVSPRASEEHPIFWHEPRRNDSVVCQCGHFATLLCDEPIGKGRTCDIALCRCCTVETQGFDQCSFHAQTDPRQEGAPPVQRIVPPARPVALRIVS